MCVYARALYAQRNRLQIYNKFLKCASARAFFLPFLLLGLRRVCAFRRILFACLGCLPAVLFLFCLLVGDVIPACLRPAVYFSPLYRRAFVHLPRFHPAPYFSFRSHFCGRYLLFPFVLCLRCRRITAALSALCVRTLILYRPSHRLLSRMSFGPIRLPPRPIHAKCGCSPLRPLARHLMPYLIGCLPAVLFLFCLLVGDVLPARLHPAVYFSPLPRRAFVHLPRFYPARAFFCAFFTCSFFDRLRFFHLVLFCP